MKVRLKQLALNINASGVIGVGGNLLFSATADLTRFAQFTDGTVLIAGRNTAQQMINLGARVKRRRPLVVITESGHVKGTTGDDDKWIYYVDSLAQALVTAHAIELELNLNGYTVVGGKRVYDDYMDLIDSGKERPNQVYIFSHEVEAPEDEEVVKLKRDLSQIKKVIEARMAVYSPVWHEADVLGKNWEGEETRSKGGRFTYITDTSLLKASDVLKVGGQLRVQQDGGEVAIDLYSITSWSRRNDINAVDITLSGGEKITVRPHSKAGLNSLLCSLNMSAHN